MLKKAVQQGRSERRGEEVPSALCVAVRRRMDLGERKIHSSASEPLSDTGTRLADSFSILLERKDRSMLDEIKNRVQTLRQLVSELRGHL
jgi:hypothetical protein